MQLCYELKTFLLAGHETSAAMLCWSLYELSQNAEALAKVGGQWQLLAAVVPGWAPLEKSAVSAAAVVLALT